MPFPAAAGAALLLLPVLKPFCTYQTYIDMGKRYDERHMSQRLRHMPLDIIINTPLLLFDAFLFAAQSARFSSPYNIFAARAD